MELLPSDNILRGPRFEPVWGSSFASFALCYGAEGVGGLRRGLEGRMDGGRMMVGGGGGREGRVF